MFLVDLGISIKLIQKKYAIKINYNSLNLTIYFYFNYSLRQCPLEFLELPMFTINCRLAMVTLNENADAEIVKKKMSSLLKGINLKIVEVVRQIIVTFNFTVGLLSIDLILIVKL